MARFVYLGPPDERVERNLHGLTGEWVTGDPRDIDDAAAVAWLRRHPHWQEVALEPADTDGDGVLTVEDARARLTELGASFDRRWGIARLREALDAAEG